MAKFTIYSPNGAALYTGTPSFTGQYRKPGMLEFRNVGVPTYIDFSPGCYVGYESGGSVVPQYPRTGFGYKIYTVPQVKKQARSGSYGGAFEYQSIQLYDASKELEYCPFRDIVKGDNRIHFSTQPSISTFEGCDGLARRFEACLRDQYDENGVQSWQVRTATATDGASPDLLNLMADAREFTVSGMNILQCLDKIYEIWPEVGWIYTVENVAGVPTNTIVIGGAGLNPNQGTYAYGKGKGLRSLTRTVANADELANRIFAYGSQRNMSSDWYRSKNIKDAGSVDIQHLMIPISQWGVTGNKPDAAKAYVQNTSSIDRIGLRLRSAYFDGTEDLPEIYPTIEGMTIGEVKRAHPDYIPSGRWSDSSRVDTLLNVIQIQDTGYPAQIGSSRIISEHFAVNSYNASVEIDSSLDEYHFEIYSNSLAGSGFAVDIESEIGFVGTVTVNKATRVWVRLEITRVGDGGTDDVLAATEIDGVETYSESGVWNIAGGDVNLGGASISEDDAIFITATVYLSLSKLDLVIPEDEGEEPYYPESRLIAISTGNGSGHLYESAYREKTFSVYLRQVGFDIAAQADLGEGKKISMRSGNCQGRSFSIKDAIYDIDNDRWELICYRSEDESIGQWFPNSIYPLAAGDKFVLLDIAMPDSYIEVAENRLLDAAQELLSDTSTERWQYTPEIDAKFMVENGLTIRPAEYMRIVGIDIVDGAQEFVFLDDTTGSNLQTSSGENLILDNSGYSLTVLVDTVVITEGESAIPTYKVTLLDKKRKVFTEAKSVSEYTANSVQNVKQVETSRVKTESTFFELCDDGSVRLKEAYVGLWAQGWISAGGVASDGGGGGGGGGGNALWGDYVSQYARKLTVAGVEETVLLNGALNSLSSSVSSLESSYNFLYQTVQSYSSDIDTLEGRCNDLTTLVGNLADQVSSIDWFVPTTVNGQATLRLNPRYAGMWADGWSSAGGVGSGGGGGGGSTVVVTQLLTTGTPIASISVDGSSTTIYAPSAPTGDFVPTSRTINGVDLSQNRVFYILGNGLSTTAAQGTMLGVSAISYDLSSTGSEQSLIKWEPGENGAVGAWHVYGNLYADGWVAAGGIGSDSGGGGGGSYTPGAGIDITGNVISVKTATTSTPGAIIVGSGLSITNGVLSATGGGGGGGSTTLAGLTDVSISSVGNGDLLSYDTSVNSGSWVPLPRATLLSGYITQTNADSRYLRLSGGTLTGTVGASGWSVSTNGTGVFYTLRGDNDNLYIGDSSNSHWVWIQEDTYIGNVKICGGTSTSSASSPNWEINKDGSANFGSVSVTGGTSSGFLKADGSVDTTTYLSRHQTIYGLTLSAGSFTGGSYNPASSAGSFNIPTTTSHIAHGNDTLNAFLTDLPNNYVTLATDQNNISGTKTFTATNLYAKNILPSSGSTYNLGSTSARWDTLFGVDADLSGDLTLLSSGHIDIGPLRIEYDNASKALHITKVSSNDTNNYGIYADGFVAAGGIQAQA